MAAASMQILLSAPRCNICPRPTSLCCRLCGNVPGYLGGDVPLTYYCSQDHANFDWVNHREHCLPARERRALFKAAAALQREYYIACEMNLDAAIKNGYNMCTMVRYNKGELQRHKDAAAGNEEHRKVLLSCFGGYNPMLSRWYGLMKHLKDLDLRIADLIVQIKYRVRQHSFDEGHASLAKDQHKVVQITAFSGERYILDVAGAQFGLFAAIVPWDKYICDNVHEIQGYESLVLADDD